MEDEHNKTAETYYSLLGAQFPEDTGGCPPELISFLFSGSRPNSLKDLSNILKKPTTDSPSVSFRDPFRAPNSQSGPQGNGGDPSARPQDKPESRIVQDNFFSSTVRWSRYTLYETLQRFYLIATNEEETQFQILKIDKVTASCLGDEAKATPQPQRAAKSHKRKNSNQSAAPKEKVKVEESEDESETSCAKPQAEGELEEELNRTNHDPNEEKSQYSEWESQIIDIDQTIYSKEMIDVVLSTLHLGNSGHGGLRVRSKGYGILGFVRFLQGYYLLMITGRQRVGLIGPHEIFSITKTEEILLGQMSNQKASFSQTSQFETRYRTLFLAMDLADFYFSYTYDLTHTLQHNMTFTGPSCYDSSFAWNHYLLRPLRLNTTANSPWIIQQIHGCFLQNSITTRTGQRIRVSVIARRSRHFAGTRFLKRGVNELGQVANDVEAEQIIETLNNSLLSPLYSLLSRNPSGEDEQTAKQKLSVCTNFTSYVQIRGSIPLFWGQEPKITDPKPPIKVQRIDPYYTATTLHFKDLFARFGTPTIVLNLVKIEEKKARESTLAAMFHDAIQQINTNLPEECKIVYVPMDFSRVVKSHNLNVIQEMTKFTENSLLRTGFFHSGFRPSFSPSLFQRSPSSPSLSSSSPVQVPTPQPLPSAVLSQIPSSSQSQPAGQYTSFPSQDNTKSSSNIRVPQPKPKPTSTSSSSSSSSTSSFANLMQNTNFEGINDKVALSGYDEVSVGRLQQGVVRSNCIDSLDRTNAAQFLIGRVVAVYQLFALGVFCDVSDIDLLDSVSDTIMDMYQVMGNKLALQYGGSNLAHNLNTYVHHHSDSLATQSRDLVTSLRRFYSNSFTDKDKQYIINLFLGNYVPYREKISLWELETDYFLHTKVDTRLSCVSVSTKWWERALAQFNVKQRRLLADLESLLSAPKSASSSSKSPEEKEQEEKTIMHQLYEKYFDLVYKPSLLTHFDEELNFKYTNTATKTPEYGAGDSFYRITQEKDLLRHKKDRRAVSGHRARSLSAYRGRNSPLNGPENGGNCDHHHQSISITLSECDSTSLNTYLEHCDLVILSQKVRPSFGASIPYIPLKRSSSFSTNYNSSSSSASSSTSSSPLSSLTSFPQGPSPNGSFSSFAKLNRKPNERVSSSSALPKRENSEIDLTVPELDRRLYSDSVSLTSFPASPEDSVMYENECLHLFESLCA